ncbi:hypothetical protein SNOG_07948 [Parastagonospora nodorum SN15]|uniref:Uncharacterized protein n=1 Tax=Phaeosphaeria nodorum (strain SN15 / ATCC MYA-4574 / FGSC 10173) TaxID=321614 RepID=Q0UJW6_PHANO|nr:hypothetical protein SNOG_07948 [Parastagonospora nodorum SN15]EAT84224.1 hypothetical protein SNOG_07948 [Parastagonospora nodorum SN15]
MSFFRKRGYTRTYRPAIPAIHLVFGGMGLRAGG